MVDRRDEYDPGHTTGANPGAAVLRGRVILASVRSAPGDHEERHGGPARPGPFPGHHRRADVLGCSGQAHLSLSPLLHLCPGGAISSQSHRRLRLRPKQLVHVQNPVCHHTTFTNEKRPPQEQFHRLRREFYRIQEYC